jgi:hypothetical protein
MTGSSQVGARRGDPDWLSISKNPAVANARSGKPQKEGLKRWAFVLRLAAKTRQSAVDNRGNFSPTSGFCSFFVY